jgi:hypothetical protein
MENILKQYKNIDLDNENIINDEKEGINTESKNKITINKIRNVPHLEGNFSTFIYLDLKSSKKIKYFIQDIKNVFLNINNEFSIRDVLKNNSDFDNICNSYHISLSRNIYLKYHEIENFINCIKKEFSHSVKSSKLLKLFLMKRVKYLTNEYNTRHFLTLQILKNKQFSKLIERIDKVLIALHLSTYYEVKSHIFIKYIGLYSTHFSFME